MRPLWRLGIGSWWTSPGRTLAIVLSVALGVGTVVTVANFYETVRRAIAREVVSRWVGSAHVSVHPVGAHWGSLRASLAEAIRQLDHVAYVSVRLQRRARLVPLAETGTLLESTWWLVDAIGIEPDPSAAFPTLPHLEGRLFGPGERRVAVIERDTAIAWKLALGDSFLLTPYGGGPKMKLTVVGLFDSQRVAEFQRPFVYLPLSDLQQLRNEPGVVSAIDVMLDDSSPAALDRAKTAIEQCVAERVAGFPFQVETAAARQLMLAEAERITRLTLVLIAFIALLTSFFLILTTQNISLMERRPQLGVMRCLGLTRRQLTALLFIELMPLGITGTVLGLAGGIGVTFFVAWAASEMIMHVYLSSWGIRLGAVSGIITCLLSTLVLIVLVGRVTPLEAVNTEARPPRLRYAYAAAGLGAVLLSLHELMVTGGDRTRWLRDTFAMTGWGSLYLGYVCLAPGVVLLLGRPIARGVGRVLGLRAKLAEDPFVRSPWRTTGACWVVMVGLSLIVYVAVQAEGLRAIWDFPGRLPEAFVWSPEYVSSDVVARVRRLPGVGPTTVSTDVPCTIQTSHASGPSAGASVVETFLRRLTKPVFVAGDPEALLSMIKVAFLEGSQEDAMDKLQRGGFVLIPPQTSKNQNLHRGDRVTVTIQGRSAAFEVAGVIQSPALDLAVTAFHAESYMEFAAASAILGTARDLQEKFGLDVVSMIMCDLDLTPAAVPPDFDPDRLPDPADDRAVASALLSWRRYLPDETEAFDRVAPVLVAWREAPTEAPPPPETRKELRRFARALQRLGRSSRTKHRTPSENWTAFRERLVLLEIAETMHRPDAIMGSLRRLKDQLDQSLHHATILLTWLPSVMLAAAALGIANLMRVSVHQRARRIAVLRAVGAQKSQILRMVLAEAITIGLLGSVMGVALGVHEAYSDNRITADLIGLALEFIVPLGTTGLAVALTVGVCLLAAIVPARQAARNNIILSLQTA